MNLLTFPKETTHRISGKSFKSFYYGISKHISTIISSVVSQNAKLGQYYRLNPSPIKRNFPFRCPSHQCECFRSHYKTKVDLNVVTMDHEYLYPGFDMALHHNDALQKNNCAVSLIEAGQIDHAAVEMLNDALRIYRRMLLLSPQDGAEESTTNRCGIDQCMEFGDQLVPCFDHSPGDTTEIDDYVYNRGIKINESWNQGAGVKENMEICSTIVIFNLAIVHHMSTKLRSSAHPRSFRRALKLYDLALRMQEGQLNEGNTLFTIAVLNNMGVIQKHMKDDDDSQRNSRIHFEFLFSMLHTLPSHMRAKRAHLDGFFRNALSVLAPPCCSAARAA